MSVVFFMAYRSFWKFWQASTPATIRHLLKPRHPVSRIALDPRVYRRRSKRLKDTDLRVRMKELASERRRFGYRRFHILLKREGWKLNRKKLYRLYREEGLTVRKRGGRKRAIGTRAPLTCRSSDLIGHLASECRSGCACRFVIRRRSVSPSLFVWRQGMSALASCQTTTGPDVRVLRCRS